MVWWSENSIINSKWVNILNNKFSLITECKIIAESSDYKNYKDSRK